MNQESLVRYIQIGVPIFMIFTFGIFIYFAAQPPYDPVTRAPFVVDSNASYASTDSYDTVQLAGWEVLVSHKLYTTPQRYGRVLYDLERHLEFGNSLLPTSVRRKLEGTTIWVETKPSAKYAGRYLHHRHRSANSNPEKSGNIELNFSNNIQHARKILAGVFLHEVAHAYHARLDDGTKQEILKHYNNAVQNRLFTGAQIKNDYVSTDYALKNEWEYFAELSALYLMEENGGRRTLNKVRDIDPNGVALVVSIY